MALDGVDVTLRTGESVAIVGRSGSGKSTLAGALSLLDRPESGRILAHPSALRPQPGHPWPGTTASERVLALDKADVWTLRARERRALRRGIGLVFQDALASFDPRYTVRQVVAEALGTRTETPARRRGTARAAGDDPVVELLGRVGLDAAYADRRPVTLSGGERQRVALARALATRPRVLLADEPTTGLDVLAQDHTLTLLTRLRHGEDLTVVFVTHDLQVAQRIADRILVLAEGRVVDDLPAHDLPNSTHPETQALLAAAPTLDPALGGPPPSI